MTAWAWNDGLSLSMIVWIRNEGWKPGMKKRVKDLFNKKCK